jgi:TetR/AcrR family transcriptional repressor of nem operon
VSSALERPRREIDLKVSKEKAEENRQRVIDTAATLLRERGIDGIGIVDLMQAAGLTHGGFYRQFKSKDDLVAQAVQRAFEMTRADIAKQLKDTSVDPLETLVRYYVSDFHKNHLGKGCSLTALAADGARHDNPALRSVFGSAIDGYIKFLTSMIQEGTATSKRHAAMRMLAEMVGAIILARVAPDQSFAKELLKTVSSDVLKRRGKA